VSEEVRAAAKDAAGITEKLSVDEPGWAPFYNALADSFFLHDVVEICGPRYTEAETCYVSVTIVAQPREGEGGPHSVVSYAAVSSTDPSSVECRQYASCISRGYLGRELPPLPGGRASGPQGTLIRWGVSPWNDDRIQVNRSKIEVCIAEHREQLNILREQGLPESNLHMLDYLLSKLEDRLSYCEWLLEELSECGRG
jgi:hypothetical protein